MPLTLCISTCERPFIAQATWCGSFTVGWLCDCGAYCMSEECAVPGQYRVERSHTQTHIVKQVAARRISTPISQKYSHRVLTKCVDDGNKAMQSNKYQLERNPYYDWLRRECATWFYSQRGRNLDVDVEPTAVKYSIPSPYRCSRCG